MSAPVQVVVIELHQPTFSGEVLRELQRLDEAGIVRLVDVLVVTHEIDGGLVTAELPADAPTGLGEVASAFLARSSGTPREGVAHIDPKQDGNANAADTWSLAEVVPRGSTAAVAFLEHLWAAPLREAMERGGGTPLEESWLSAHDLQLLEKLRRSAAAKI